MPGIPAAAAGHRLAVLDGIRGWASLIVLVSHFLLEANRAVLPELHSIPVAMIFDGPLIVIVFFILSGQALSAGYFQRADLGILRTMAARRYLRLTLPILMASALVWLCMVSGLDAHRDAAVVLQSDWLGGFLQFTPHFSGLLGYALRDVYFDPPFAFHYIPLLWTMHIELLGSCVVLGLLALLHGWGMRQRLVCYIAALVLLKLFDPRLLGFVLGMLLAEARQRGVFERLRQSRWRGHLILLGLALLFGISAMRAVAQHHGTLWSLLPASFSRIIDAVAAYPGPTLLNANALGLFLLIPLIPALGRLLSGRVSRFLGRISFSLYLVQFAVLITLSSSLVVALIDPAQPAHAKLYCIAAAGIAASLLLAWGFSVVERRVQRLVNAMVARALGGSEASNGRKRRLSEASEGSPDPAVGDRDFSAAGAG